MPITCRNGEEPRYRSRWVSPVKRQRLCYCGKKVVEVKNFFLKNGVWREGKTVDAKIVKVNASKRAKAYRRRKRRS